MRAGGRGAVRRSIQSSSFGVVSLASLSVILCLLAPAASSAQPEGRSGLNAPREVLVGQPFSVSARPGGSLGGREAVLEAATTPGRTELARGFVKPDGTVRLSTVIAVPGEYSLRMRVLEGRTTAWSSPQVTVTAQRGGQRSSVTDMGSGMRMAGHAQRPPTQVSDSRVRARPAWDDDFELGEDLDDLEVGAAESAQTLNILTSSISGALSSPVGQFLGEAVADWGVGAGLDLLVSVIFPGQGNNSAAAIAAISGQLQEIQSQLNSIQTSLASLEAQVTQEYAQLNAVDTDGTCVTLMDEANGYVNTIQLAQENMQLAMTPAWLQANVGPYANSTAGIRAVGNQVFGSGGGTPSFASGVFATQQAVTDLANLMVNNGAADSTGLIAACASAVSAEIAANPSPYFATGTSILPIGTVDDAYFIQLQQIMGYYAGWVALGQALTAQGGRMAIAMLSPQSFNSASQVTQLCYGTAAAGTPNMITCSGLLAQIAQTQATLAVGWNLTGASWRQVSDGVLAADTQVSAASGSLEAPLGIWALDLGAYGSGSGSQAVTPSTQAATGPASSSLSNGVMQPSVANWIGLNFGPATSSMWDRALGVSSAPPYPGAQGNAAVACVPALAGTLTSCAAPSTIGASMAAAGLAVNGSKPANLIFYTGESSQWTPLESAAISDARFFNYVDGAYRNLLPNLSTMPYGIQSFLDTSMVPTSGASVVIGNPSTTIPVLTPASVYPYYLSPSTSSGWTPTVSTSVPSASTGVALVNCPGSVSPINPYPNAVPLTYGSLLGAANGSQASLVSSGLVNQNQSQMCGFANTPSATTPGVPAGGVPLTENSAFYGDFIGSASSSDYQGNVSTTLNWSQTSVPGFVSDAGGVSTSSSFQAQYVWPVANPTKPGCPALTTFSQGYDGSANATNTCLGWWQEWSAVYNAQTTGPIVITAAPSQGTLQASGSNLATVVLTNSSSSSELVTLTVASASGAAQVQSLLTPFPGSNLSISGCTTPSTQANLLAPTVSGGTIISCSVILPQGTSAINIPVGYGSGSTGSIVAAVSGTSIASAVTFSVSSTPGFAQTPPAPIANLSISASSSSTATLSWQTPSSTPPLIGYQLTTTSPSGTSATSTLPLASVTVAGQTSSASTPIPSSQPGYWEFTLAGVNSAGTGLSAIVTSYLGSGPPPAPANLTATENPDSTVTLSWSPISAMPVVSGYRIVATDPAGVPRAPVTVSVPAYTTSALGHLGVWTFSVSATNTAGSGPASTATVPLVGTPPSLPVNLAVSVSSNGWVSTSWGAPTSSVPAPSSYLLRIYDSSGRLVRALPIATSGNISTVSVPDYFTLGTNSPTGAWTVVVSARNATGQGQTARSLFLVTPGLISGIGRSQTVDSELGQLPQLLVYVDESECRSGFAVTSSYGSCNKRVWTSAGA